MKSQDQWSTTDDGKVKAHPPQLPPVAAYFCLLLVHSCSNCKYISHDSPNPGSMYNRDRGAYAPLPHHRTCGSASGGSAKCDDF
jgi:hypothetical protein